MVVPILLTVEVAGLLYISNRAPRAFTDEDEMICVRLAEQAAVAIQNARLFGRQEAARAEAGAVNRARDEFLAMLGHGLRNPLGAISNAAHLLTLAESRGGDTTRARDIIARQVQHLARLVDDLLDVSRVVAGKVVLRLQPLELAETARRVAALHGGPRGGRHVIRVEATPVWVSADPTRLEQVLTNLLANAVKYTPAGGEIVLSVQPEGQRAVLRVRDSGAGIRPELLPRVFDLFVQGDRSLERTGGGLGIGLTLVRHLIELHGGTVEAASAGLGRGSTFTVRLPALAAVPAPSEAARPASAGPAQRILIIEDNDDARETLRNLLHLLGHEVHEACDGDSGVDEARRLRPDVALIDIGLPGIDGYEVARRVRADVPRARLVAVTGYGQPDDLQRAWAAGFDVHLVKPVDRSSFNKSWRQAPAAGPVRWTGARARSPSSGSLEASWCTTTGANAQPARGGRPPGCAMVTCRRFRSGRCASSGRRATPASPAATPWTPARRPWRSSRSTAFGCSSTSSVTTCGSPSGSARAALIRRPERRRSAAPRVMARGLEYRWRRRMVGWSSFCRFLLLHARPKHSGDRTRDDPPPCCLGAPRACRPRSPAGHATSSGRWSPRSCRRAPRTTR